VGFNSRGGILKPTLLASVLIVGDGLQAFLLAEKLRLSGISSVLLRKESLSVSQTMTSQCYMHSGHFYRSPTLVKDLTVANQIWTKYFSNYDVEVFHQKCVVLLDRENRQEWIDSWNENSLHFEEVSKPSKHPLNPSPEYSMFNVNAKWINGAGFLNTLAKSHHHSIISGQIDSVVESSSGYEIQYSNVDHEGCVYVKAIVFASGLGNADLIKKIDQRQKNVQQNRKCQIVILESELPLYSAVVPTDQLFIVPLASNDRVKVRWLCTFGTDPVADYSESNAKEIDMSRQTACIDAIGRVFPWFDKVQPRIQCGVIPTWKAESSLDGKGERPNSYSIYKVQRRVLAVWPTKLTLIPLATEEIFKQLEKIIFEEKQPVPEYSHEASMSALS
jgi:hypothetical protein